MIHVFPLFSITEPIVRTFGMAKFYRALQRLFQKWCLEFVTLDIAPEYELQSQSNLSLLAYVWLDRLFEHVRSRIYS